ncbi:hypothetical protein N1851_006399 [Merluccius polli]|uniref:Uncharacterized protein n=1 Tax=Merluccius polli TaxID=89951 RepID=A0AA47N4F5_MERPO|nr:hypothetical protein N1851_006399 [Merluccius polli]
MTFGNFLLYQKMIHLKQYAVIQSIANTSGCRHQPNSHAVTGIVAAFEKVRKYTTESKRDITAKVIEFIALDDQPFSVVKDRGFSSLLSTLELQYTLPILPIHIENIFLKALAELCTKVYDHVRFILHDNEVSISFTIDIWSSSMSPISMLSLMTQRISSEFELQRAFRRTRVFRFVFGNSSDNGV